MSIEKNLFGTHSDGRDVYIYTLKNSNGAEARITDYGATIVNLLMPDRDGVFADVIGGYDTFKEYTTAGGYQGATIGRYANRIGNSSFTLEGQKYQLTTNEYGNQLHGGLEGFNKKIWKTSIIDADEPTLEMTYFSPDGEEGFPGNVEVKVTYILTNENALVINYKAISDKKTPFNMTNHSYFNIGGFNRGTVRDQILTLDADRFLATDEELIPTGEICDVTGTPFDFREPKEIGKDIEADDINIKYGNGYDTCFVFSGGESTVPVLRATVYDKISGRYLEMLTDQPCIQIYTYNEPTNPAHPLKNGMLLEKYSFICLETEKMPDSPNHDNFTNCYIEAGELYDYTTIYKFSTK